MLLFFDDITRIEDGACFGKQGTAVSLVFEIQIGKLLRSASCGLM